MIRELIEERLGRREWACGRRPVRREPRRLPGRLLPARHRPPEPLGERGGAESLGRYSIGASGRLGLVRVRPGAEGAGRLRRDGVEGAHPGAAFAVGRGVVEPGC